MQGDAGRCRAVLLDLQDMRWDPPSVPWEWGAQPKEPVPALREPGLQVDGHWTRHRWAEEEGLLADTRALGPKFGGWGEGFPWAWVENVWSAFENSALRAGDEEEGCCWRGYLEQWQQEGSSTKLFVRLGEGCFHMWTGDTCGMARAASRSP